MKKKGFTLIELLAVIVILAIISLIAVPQVLNIISDARVSSNRVSANNYVKALEMYITSNKLSTDFNSGMCVYSNEITKCNGEVVDVKFDGKIDSATVIFENGKVSYYNIDFDDNESICSDDTLNDEESDYYYSYIYDAPVTYSISDNCESIVIGYGISPEQASEMCNGTISSAIQSLFDVDKSHEHYPYLEEYLAGRGVLNQESNGNIIGVSIVGMKNTPQILNIPSTINNYPVLRIGIIAFSEENISSLILPSTIERIEISAFDKCNLSNVDFSRTINLKYIGTSAFSYNKIKNIDLPNNLKTIGYGSFEYNNLTSIKIPDSVETIGEYAFVCNNLESVEIGTNISSLNSIGMLSFGSITSTDEESGITYGPNKIKKIKIHKPEGSLNLSNTGLNNDIIQWN